MTKEIPLSLQVFHSSNEYQAQRLNRTEQIRLKDLHQVLKREEKLYMKDYWLYRQRFHSHYNKRRTEPATSNSSSINRNSFSSISVSSRTSISSAPAKLQTTRANSMDSSLASRVCSSLGEITTLTRFQRVQRKFSLASFTENGLLTARGSRMSKNIDKARDILFKNKTNSLPGKSHGIKIEYVPENNGGNEEILINVEDENKQIVLETRVGETHPNDLKEKAGSKFTEQNSEAGTEHFNKRQNLSFDAILEESPNTDNANVNHIHAQSDCSNSTNRNNSRKSLTPNSAKKRVTIQSTRRDSSVIEEDDREDSRSPFDNEDTSRPGTASVDVEISKNFKDWRSRFSRQVKRLDPLQQKINGFLADQSEFNRIFPKRFDGTAKACAVQKELAEIGREKRDQEKKERKKKNDIVLEVLNKLGIEDEAVVSIYQD